MDQRVPRISRSISEEDRTVATTKHGATTSGTGLTTTNWPTAVTTDIRLLTVHLMLAIAPVITMGTMLIGHPQSFTDLARYIRRAPFMRPVVTLVDTRRDQVSRSPSASDEGMLGLRGALGLRDAQNAPGVPGR